MIDGLEDMQAFMEALDKSNKTDRSLYKKLKTLRDTVMSITEQEQERMQELTWEIELNGSSRTDKDY